MAGLLDSLRLIYHCVIYVFYDQIDVSEDQASDYPPRLCDEGASNLENKNINHNGRMGNILRIRDAIRKDVWDNLNEFHVGVITKLADNKFVWYVHYLQCRQLRVYKKKIWCLLVDRPLRFSLHKFGEITGLNTYPLPTKSFEPEPYLYKAF